MQMKLRSNRQYGASFPAEPYSPTRAVHANRYTSPIIAPRTPPPSSRGGRDDIWETDLANHVGNFYQFVDPKTKYVCTIRRHTVLLAYMVYVKLEADHPYYTTEGDDGYGPVLRTLRGKGIDLIGTEYGQGMDFMHLGDFVPGTRGTRYCDPDHSHYDPERSHYTTYEEAVLEVVHLASQFWELCE